MNTIYTQQWPANFPGNYKEMASNTEFKKRKTEIVFTCKTYYNFYHGS